MHTFRHGPRPHVPINDQRRGTDVKVARPQCGTAGGAAEECSTCARQLCCLMKLGCCCAMPLLLQMLHPLATSTHACNLAFWLHQSTACAEASWFGCD